MQHSHLSETSDSSLQSLELTYPDQSISISDHNQPQVRKTLEVEE